MTADFSKEVDFIARLARLTLDPDEKKRMAVQLNDILGTARRVQELDTTGIEPASHAITLPAVLREDETRPSLPLNMVLQNAPRHQGDFFRVPGTTAVEQSGKQPTGSIFFCWKHESICS
ncbi:MAG TPA: Asp-tRNA(Asn)/Glu-tRNA(Gln) amidotransferase subunit GatC [Candidatus Limnocylindrales bacterium]|nr:Asp-tRNA(Asn)/Glu-tRNA(Gln) amidotransferase subunit GatC [Candidatus Limnocylindrales bacterium]